MGRGSVDCNFIINSLFSFFLVFHGVGEVGGKLVNFSVNMGDRSQWSQNIGHKHWRYQRQMIWGQGRGGGGQL